MTKQLCLALHPEFEVMCDSPRHAEDEAHHSDPLGIFWDGERAPERKPSSMYERAYFEAQHVLSEALGTEPQGCAGLAADVDLLAKQRDAAVVRVAELTRERDEACEARDLYRRNWDAAREGNTALLDRFWAVVLHPDESGRPVAQEATEHADDCQGCEHIPGAIHCTAQEAGDPPVPRVWRKGDPEPPADVALLRVEPGGTEAWPGTAETAMQLIVAPLTEDGGTDGD